MPSPHQQSLQLLLLFSRAHLYHTFHATAPAAALLREHVIARGLAMEDLALPRDAETLGGRAVGLRLRHVRSTLRPMRRPVPRAARPPAAAPIPSRDPVRGRRRKPPDPWPRAPGPSRVPRDAACWG